MRKLLFPFLIALVITTNYSCNVLGERIKGNGRMATSTRSVDNASRIKVMGGIDVELVPGPNSIKVEADENLMPYIMTDMEGDWLEIRWRDHVNIETVNPVKVTISTPTISRINVAGSGKVVSLQEFDSGKQVRFDIAGSGDINMMINAPSVRSHISGSGKMHLMGETKDVNVEIRGSGDFDGADLKAENADVHISGSGSAIVFADIRLKASIRGSGRLTYHGNPEVERHISGSGSVAKLP
jgi:hypothetical protein